MTEVDIIQADVPLVFQADIRYIQREERHLFINPEEPDWLMTNGNGAILLSMCDGARCPSDIAAVAVENGMAQADVEALFSNALRHSIVSPVTAARGPVEPQAYESRIETLLIKVTNKCNLRCDYCYANSGLGDSLSKEDLFSILDAINERHRGIGIELSGGEPLMNKATLPFARAVRASGHRVSLLTNGTLINETNAAEIASVFHTIQISIDGSEAGGHDCHRGEGSHAKATAAADMLIALGANVQIGMTLTFGSKDGLAGMIEKYGERLKVKPMTSIGRGSAQIGALTADEHYQFVDPYYRSEEVGNPRRKTAAFVQKQRRKRASKCAIGDMHVSISETGDIYPCHLIHDEKFKGGNIREEGLWNVYDRSPVFTRLQKFSVDQMTPCSGCAVRRLCVGGCPAVSFGETGRIDVAASFCDFERARYIDAIFDVEDGLLQ